GDGGGGGQGGVRAPAERVGATVGGRLAGFVRTLRDNGFAVGLAETRDALSILASPAAMRPTLLQPALRALFCATRSDWERFDEIFAAYWQGRGVRHAASTSRESPSSMQHSAASAPQGPPGSPDYLEAGDGQGGEHIADRREHAAAASTAERLAAADLRHTVDPQEIAQTQALAERLAHR